MRRPQNRAQQDIVLSGINRMFDNLKIRIVSYLSEKEQNLSIQQKKIALALFLIISSSMIILFLKFRPRPRVEQINLTAISNSSTERLPKLTLEQQGIHNTKKMYQMLQEMTKSEEGRMALRDIEMKHPGLIDSINNTYKHLIN